MIRSGKAAYPVGLMCEALGVSRSGYYDWESRAPSKRSVEDAALVPEIRRIHQASRSTYGSPRVHEELCARGKRHGRKRVARLMREVRLRARVKKRFRRTTDSNHPHPIAPNLLNRNCRFDAPDRACVGDITYLWTGEGWLYLAALVDLFSRRVVGWSSSESLETDLALGALEMALGHREGEGVMHHTDRGCPYASKAYRERLDKGRMVPSMSRRANCWDNAVAESFFSTLKMELVYRTHWATRDEARLDVHEYIEVFYNRQRRHSSIGYLTPVEAERRYYDQTEQDDRTSSL